MRLIMIFEKAIKKLAFIKWKHRLANIGESCAIDQTVELRNCSRISLGNKCTIRAYAIVNGAYNNQGSIILGDNCTIGEFAVISSYGGIIEIGNHCSINPHCVVYGHGGLKIGNYVRIAANTVIIPANHIFSDRETQITKQGLSLQGIVIEDDVWIGAGAIITDGVRICKGAVIGAGAVVTSDIPSYQVWVGVPARYLRDR